MNVVGKKESDAREEKKSEEVVYSGEAFRIVSSWLGGEANEDSDVDARAAAPRPPGLGLGAKFVPHKKAVALNAGAAKSLEKRIGGVVPFRGPIRVHQDSSEESEELLPCTSSDEEEEESKVVIVSTKRKVGEKRGASEMQTELLRGNLKSQGSSKKRRKNRKRKGKNRRKNQE